MDLTAAQRLEVARFGMFDAEVLHDLAPQMAHSGGQAARSRTFTLGPLTYTGSTFPTPQAGAQPNGCADDRFDWRAR